MNKFILTIAAILLVTNCQAAEEEDYVIKDPPSLCKPNEKIIATGITDSRPKNKIMSICAKPNKSGDFDYIEFRFGSKSSINLSYKTTPETKNTHRFYRSSDRTPDIATNVVDFVFIKDGVKYAIHIPDQNPGAAPTIRITDTKTNELLNVIFCKPDLNNWDGGEAANETNSSLFTEFDDGRFIRNDRTEPLP